MREVEGLKIKMEGVIVNPLFYGKIKAMSKKKKKRLKINFLESERGIIRRIIPKSSLDVEIRNSLYAILFLCLALILILSSLNLAGPIGRGVFKVFDYLLGWGYFVLPTLFLLISFIFFRSLSNEKINFTAFTLQGCFCILFSLLSIFEIFANGSGGMIGFIGALLKNYLGLWPTLIIYVGVLVSGFLLVLNIPLRFIRKKTEEEKNEEVKEVRISSFPESTEEKLTSEPEEAIEKIANKEQRDKEVKSETKMRAFIRAKSNYKFPSLDLLETESIRPRVGDITANANIIKRTLQNFGIDVEMGEVNVGPTVTQYTFKPAEGVKLSSVTALQNDLALALAAHPLRIEAPIPGRSLVGVEVPNKSISLVRLGSLLKESDFQKTASSLTFALGRNVKGEGLLADLSKMPHLLIAGSTGSGKSVCIHSILTSFLLKNSPETLRLILIDPKRVELSHYNEIPHLLTPVITDYKKVLPALRWAVNEMERRYNLLSEYKSRDIEGYNLKALAKKEMPLPYIVIIIDELADLMVRYGRDLEGLIIRIAQMARATGIHLIVSTQRPSVEVITGLIKANITARIAFQVASQVDSRTILDIGGAEKLLGSGDMLYLAPDSSKPRRIQSAYVSEQEVNKLVSFIIKESGVEKEKNGLSENLQEFIEGSAFPASIDFEELGRVEEDELYSDAYDVVVQAQKASASLLQRRLRIGYARAARLLDILEEKGVIGPANGAKPREVFVKPKKENYEQ